MGSLTLAAVVVETLVRSGVEHVVLAPGSRNAPLSLALHAADRDGRVHLHVRIDERVAAFTALGIGKATGRAAAVVTTSGSATANLAPAAMEARHAGVPLLLLTADRPSDMVGTGANQVGQQVGILGPSALDVVRLSSTSGSTRSWSAAIVRAHTVASGIRTRDPGPVQVNLEFAAPLVGEVPGADVVVPTISHSVPEQRSHELDPSALTVVVAGDAPPVVGAEARAFAEVAGLPLLAEPSSNARGGPHAIAGYRLLLDGELGDRIQRVVVFGHPTLSRPVSALLSRADVEVVVVADRARWHDLGSTASAVVDAVTMAPGDGAWLQQWRHADAGLDPSDHEWGGEQVAATLLGVLDADDILFLGASACIRDADLAPVGDSPPRVLSNRGLSGIDGIVSTASGVALGLGRQVTVLLGDLSLQHDLGALARPRLEAAAPLRIVVVDDDGGAIFHTLEQGAPEYAHAFERVFGTPQGLDLVEVARAMGWETSRVASREELLAALALPGDRVIVAEVDRGRRRTR